MGTGELGSRISDEIMASQDSGYKIAAFFGDAVGKLTETKAPFFQEYSQLQQVCQQTHAEKIVVALDDQRGKLPIKDLLSCKLR